jgi:hypothetical protein
MTEISQTTPQEQTQNNTPTQKYLPIEKKSGFFLQIGLISLLLSLVFYTFFLWEDL